MTQPSAPAPDAPATVLVVSARAMFRRTFASVARSLGRPVEERAGLDEGGAEPGVDPRADLGAGHALVVLDLGGADAAGAAAHLGRARGALGDTVPIGAVIDHPDEAVVDALVGAGAAGVLVKASPPTALVESLGLLLGGATCRPAPEVIVPVGAVPEAVRARLGGRDQKLLRLIAGGRSVPSVAAELHLTPAKVVTELRRIMEIVRRRG